MGMLQEAVNSFDKSDDNADDISATLDLIVKLTESKAKIYENIIEESLNRGKILGKSDSTDSLFFPISSVKDRRIEYRCIKKDVPTDLISTIGEAISGMISDHSAENIVKGVAKVINTGLETLMGLSEGMEQYTSSTSTFIDGKGIAVNIVRLDTIIWGRAIKASSIKNTIKNTFACVAYKSVVDVTKLNFDDFRSVYATVIESSGETNVEVALKKAKEVYDVLGGGSALDKVIDGESALNKVLNEVPALNKVLSGVTALNKEVVKMASTELLELKPMSLEDLTFCSESIKADDYF